MKKLILILTVLNLLVGINGIIAQQKSLDVLIRTSLNGVNNGFPSLIKDTIPDSGEWNYKIKPEVTLQFARVRDIKINILQNHKSVSNDNVLYNLNQMNIICEDAAIPAGLSESDYLDSLNSYYNKIVNYFIQEYGADYFHTDIIKLQNLINLNTEPVSVVYFYEKSVRIPESLKDTKEIERQLGVTNWLAIELRHSLSNTGSFCLAFRISGARRD